MLIKILAVKGRQSQATMTKRYMGDKILRHMDI